MPTTCVTYVIVSAKRMQSIHCVAMLGCVDLVHVVLCVYVCVIRMCVTAYVRVMCDFVITMHTLYFTRNAVFISIHIACVPEIVFQAYWMFITAGILGEITDAVSGIVCDVQLW